jgi:hypothetical protein
MSKNYLSNKAAKRSFALKGIFVLIVLAIVFAGILLRFAFSDTRFKFLNSPPNSDDAYAVAKQFIKPTIKSLYVNFPQDGFQCAQKPDSVFIIKSYAETKDKSGGKNITSYEITLKFLGGAVSSRNSWKMVNLIEN